MAKIIVLPIVVCLLLAATARGEHFRGFSWGDSEASVRDGESAEFITAASPVEGMKVLVFGDFVAGVRTFVVYILAHDQLVHSKYLFAERHVEGNLFLSDFKRIDEILRDKYGEPVAAGEIWRNEVRPAGDYPEAIAMGDLVLVTRWETDATDFIHVMRGENLQITHEVDYVSKELGELESEVIAEAEKEKL
jgi:hypothetical protein